MDSEEWRSVVGYEGSYEVSSIGRVRSLDRTINGPKGRRLIRGRLMVQRITHRGYLRVCLAKNGESSDHFVHRLVAYAFIGVPDGDLYINHIDGNKTNNVVGNLEWTTMAENAQHAHRMGIVNSARGESHPSSKLTAEQVVDIRTRYAAGGISQAELAREYGVQGSSIRKILIGKNWTHIGPHHTELTGAPDET